MANINKNIYFCTIKIDLTLLYLRKIFKNMRDCPLI